MKQYLVILLLFMSTLFCGSIKADNLDKTNIAIGLTSEKEIVSIFNDKAIIDTTNFNFQQFWITFRQAVIDNDTIEIIQHTKFPFKTRGPQDSDPIVKYDRQDFIRVFMKYLNQDSGMGISNETQLEVIKKIESICKKEDKYYSVVENWARVGDLEFELNEKKWKLTFAYLNYPTIEELNNK